MVVEIVFPFINKLFYAGKGHLKSEVISKFIYGFNSHGNFAEWLDFAFWRSCNEKGLRTA